MIFRFAPSPTGYMHVGNARTAIFNYLLAQTTNSKMLLRIEDTDRERSTKESIQVIIDSLNFLNIKWDNDQIVYQSENQDEHQKYAHQLLEQGLAYKCYLTKEDLEEIKEKNKQNGTVFRSPYRDSNENINKEYVVRFKVPENQEVSFEDKVQGNVKINTKDIGDFTLLRSDGSPVYLLSVVVDDHNMNVDYALRGADHLTNTFKQILLFQAFNWKVPEYGHVPLILAQTGEKLSKRNGAMSVLDYKANGILSEALFNYLMKLGWGYKDEEFIPFDRALEIFSEKGLRKSAAKFDEQKLLSLNKEYMKNMDEEALMARCYKYAFEFMNEKYDQAGWDRFLKALPELKSRANNLKDLIIMGAIFLKTEIECEDMEINLDSSMISKLEQFFTNQYNENSLEELEQAFRNFCDENDILFKEVAGNLRKKLTGRKISPNLFITILALGQELCLKRLKS